MLRVDPAAVEGLCPHLRPVLAAAVAAGVRVTEAHTTFGHVVKLDREPPLPVDRAALRAVREDPRSYGFALAWRCREHHQEVAWGDVPWEEPSPGFALALHQG